MKLFVRTLKKPHWPSWYRARMVDDEPPFRIVATVYELAIWRLCFGVEVYV
jgi:hypothetical protein